MFIYDSIGNLELIFDVYFDWFVLVVCKIDGGLEFVCFIWGMLMLVEYLKILDVFDIGVINVCKIWIWYW